MRKSMNRITVALLIGLMTGVMAFAKTKKETVTFAENLKINDTLVKKGKYDLKFDNETGQLSVMKNGKAIATAPARVEKRDSSAKSVELRSSGTGDDARLVSVAFSGSNENIVLNQGGQTTGNQ
jgi:hypothetical protein